jgi:cell division protein FtsI/penicillin-binding protein 2
MYSGIAWGQSVLTATPASMARMAGAIANQGILQPSRYCLEEAGTIMGVEEGVQVCKDSAYASVLKQYMIDQSSTPGRQKVRSSKVAGKTGTPERIINGLKQQDGWYVFFAPKPDGKSYTVACIRIEEGQTTANAVVVANTVANILQKREYMGSF